jgi:hypothetical protein
LHGKLFLSFKNSSPLSFRQLLPSSLLFLFILLLFSLLPSSFLYPTRQREKESETERVAERERERERSRDERPREREREREREAEMRDRERDHNWERERERADRDGPRPNRRRENRGRPVLHGSPEDATSDGLERDFRWVSWIGVVQQSSGDFRRFQKRFPASPWPCVRETRKTHQTGATRDQQGKKIPSLCHGQ